MRRLGVAGVLLGTSALFSTFHTKSPSPVLVASARSQALTLRSALTAAATTDALLATSTLRTFLRYFGFRIPSALDALSANLIRIKAQLLAATPSPADPVLLHLAASPVEPARLLATQLAHRPVVAVELDVACLAGESLLARYGVSVMAFAAAWSSYLAGRATLAALPSCGSRLGDDDLAALDAAVLALTRLADVAMAHGISVILACDAARDDRGPAIVGAAALAGVLARVYGPAAPFFVKIGVAELSQLDVLSGSMFAIKGDGPGIYVIDDCGTSSFYEDFAFVSAQNAREAQRTSSHRIVYSDGVADLHVARLRRFRGAGLVRREVIADSAADECNVLARIAAEEGARHALKLEAAALWHVVLSQSGIRR